MVLFTSKFSIKYELSLMVLVGINCMITSSSKSDTSSKVSYHYIIIKEYLVLMVQVFNS